jgi:hypothetical protein
MNHSSHFIYDSSGSPSIITAAEANGSSAVLAHGEDMRQESFKAVDNLARRELPVDTRPWVERLAFKAETARAATRARSESNGTNLKRQ